MSVAPRVLVVDDDPACLRILRKFLEKEGYQVMVAADGASGLAQAQQAKPELIICDWMMPGVDGPQVCQTIKGDPALRNTFFIFLTALEKSYISEAIAQGADDFITKPIDPVEVGAKVKAGLRLTQAQKALQDLARRDELTGIYNRRHWDHSLEEACRRAERPFLVVMADVDRFKEINDQWGHRVGDAFLQELAQSWSNQLEEPELLARHGGDEFACLYYRSLGSLLGLRKRVEKSLAAAFSCPVGLSLGYARFQPDQRLTPATLMAQADRALYEEKSQHQAALAKTRATSPKKKLLEKGSKD